MVAVSVNTVGGIHDVQIVMGLIYVKLTENRIIQDVEAMVNANMTYSVLTALRIYSQMILGP